MRKKLQRHHLTDSLFPDYSWENRVQQVYAYTIKK